MYSASDMHALNEAFLDQPTQPDAVEKQQSRNVEEKKWIYGQVPDLGPRQEGTARGKAQLEYARTLLSVVMEAAVQLETVVENLEKMRRDQVADSPEIDTAAIEPKTPQAANEDMEARSHKSDPYQ
jgi:hypothetical protein